MNHESIESLQKPDGIVEDVDKAQAMAEAESSHQDNRIMAKNAAKELLSNGMVDAPDARVQYGRIRFQKDMDHERHLRADEDMANGVKHDWTDRVSDDLVRTARTIAREKAEKERTESIDKMQLTANDIIEKAREHKEAAAKAAEEAAIKYDAIQEFMSELSSL